MKKSRKALKKSETSDLCDRSNSGTWFLVSRAAPVMPGKKCFGISRVAPDSTLAHRPKVPLCQDCDNISDIYCENAYNLESTR